MVIILLNDHASVFCSIQVPTGDRLQTASPEFYSAEEAGMDFAMKGAAFVLVAGGLGERLGYNGIKISLPIDLITEKTFIQYYVEYILAFQDRCEGLTTTYILFSCEVILTKRVPYI